MFFTLINNALADSNSWNRAQLTNACKRSFDAYTTKYGSISNAPSEVKTAFVSACGSASPAVTCSIGSGVGGGSSSCISASADEWKAARLTIVGRSFSPSSGLILTTEPKDNIFTACCAPGFTLGSADAGTKNKVSAELGSPPLSCKPCSAKSYKNWVGNEACLPCSERIGCLSESGTPCSECLTANSASKTSDEGGNPVETGAVGCLCISLSEGS